MLLKKTLFPDLETSKELFCKTEMMPFCFSFDIQITFHRAQSCNQANLIFPQRTGKQNWRRGEEIHSIRQISQPFSQNIENISLHSIRIGNIEMNRSLPNFMSFFLFNQVAFQSSESGSASITFRSR